MKAAVIGVLKDLHEGDRFNILKFSEIVEYYKDSMVYANKKSIDDAKEYVESLSPTGGTCQSLPKKKIVKMWTSYYILFVIQNLKNHLSFEPTMYKQGILLFFKGQT